MNDEWAGRAWINAIGTAVPGHDIHDAFVGWASNAVATESRRLFVRMAARADIAHRWSVLPTAPDGGSPVDAGGFYAGEAHPGTGERMRVYAEEAPRLALDAIGRLAAQVPLGHVTHLVVASCTGFVAPGIDQIIAERLGLPRSTERLLVGFMGCYAAVAALRSARHIVRSEPDARVLVVCVELSTLHLQRTDAVEPLLAMLQFGDGAGAALVTGEPGGLSIERPFAVALPGSAELIRWTITDQGFAMHLSGEVPARIGAALSEPEVAATIGAARVDRWAVHAGGRSILDAVAKALALPEDALDASRAVLREQGNMSSATLMFVLARVLGGPPVAEGRAIAFGPGLAAEGFAFRSAA